MFLSRRRFLKAGLAVPAVASLTPNVPDFLVRSCAGVADSSKGDRVLVVLQLTGGNDGLNTVVPYADDIYNRSRPTIRLPKKELHKIDKKLGFHPRMQGFMKLYKEGHLGIVQAAGSPHISGDHQVAMKVWHTADPDSGNRATGWLGRVADTFDASSEANIPVALVSSINKPFALNAEYAIIPSVHSLDDLTLGNTPPDTSGPGELDSDNPLLNHLRMRQARCRLISRRITDLSGATDHVEYPSFALADNLRTIARLIRADTGIRIFFTELGGDGFGGFDNHANQIGNHCALLQQLSESITAFVGNLSKHGILNKVLLMTFSEFGRTLEENGRRGTNHGSAAPVFLAGGGLKGGLVGEHPDLSNVENGRLKVGIDFRRIYSTVLENWLGFDSKVVLGQQFTPVDFLKT